jgi:hypothetical protein
VPRASIEAAIASEPKKLLPSGIKSLAGQHWLKLADFKRHLRDRHGIVWQEHFTGNRKPPNPTERTPT